MSVLLCYENVAKTEFSYFFSLNQANLIADQINSLILEIAGISSESVLEKVIKQQMMTSYLFKTIKNSFGDNILIKF